MKNEKFEGNINTAVGSIKEGLGSATRDSDLESEGEIQKIKGRTQKFSAAVQNAIKKSKSLFGMKPKRS